VVLVASGVVAVLALQPFASGATTWPGPAPAVTLPATAEALSPYLPQVSCDPVPKPGVVAFAQLMMGFYQRGTNGGITRACDIGGTSEHKEGRAFDWMLSVSNSADAKVATDAINWLLAPGPQGEVAWNARRLGVMYIIWNGRIWGAYRAAEGWRPYSGESEHLDHVHFSFSWAGAMKRTSWWTGKVAATDYGPCVTVAGQPAPKYTAPNYSPCPAPGTKLPGPARGGPPPYAWPGASGANVVAVQTAMRVSPVSGFYGPVTTAAVAAFQRNHRLAPTGVMDQRLAFGIRLPGAVTPPMPPFAKPGDHSGRVVAVQRLVHVRPASGFYGRVTTKAVAAWQRAHHLPGTGVVDLRTAITMRLVKDPRPAPVWVAPGQRGSRVVALQRALHVSASGWYGPTTTTAVTAFQRSHHLSASGVADLTTAHLLRLV
jgi:peptidoglycan hydrolase-like protein with peptidoglycan-binding domain